MNENNLIGDDKTGAFVARCKCGCNGIIMATVDIPGNAAEAASEVTDCIRGGYKVEYVTVGYVREFTKQNKWWCLKKEKPVTRHYAHIDCGNEKPGDQYTENDDPAYVTCQSCRNILVIMAAAGYD